MRHRPGTSTAATLSIAVVVLGGITSAGWAVLPFVTGDTERESRRLDEECAAVQAIARARAVVLADLAAGRVSLADATEVSLGLFNQRPNTARVIPDEYAGGTFRESVARHAVAYALLATDDPAERAELAVRLGDEFRAMFPGAEPVGVPPDSPPTDVDGA